MSKGFLGVFEQMVLLGILRQGENAFGLEVRREIESSTGRKVSRSAFYTTLDRLEAKGFVKWTSMVSDSPRRIAPIRLFSVTKKGLVALRDSRGALEALWRGMDEVVEG
ncbi:MAG: helix-turn-helix transcriptional regulator [Gemmatimonadota bacterium]|nr:MAG: helix-turn-helix transcriptional regulator [Gemmatimonadota bacterium]